MRAADIRFLERLVFLLLMAAVFAWVAWESRDFPRLARVFPNTVSLVALVLCGVELVRMLVNRWLLKSQAPDPEEETTVSSQLVAALPYLLWIGGYYAAIWVFGFVIASGLFVFLFGTLLGKMRWSAALGATALLIVFLLVFGDALNLHWPRARLEGWLGIDLP